MKSIWNYFLAHGDKWLAFATAVLAAAQAMQIIQPSDATPILALLTWLHNTFLPEPSSPVPSALGANPTNVAKVLMLGMAASWLCGCAALGLTKPVGVQQQIAYAYSGVTAALNTLANATSQGLVTSTEAVQANQNILAAKALIDQANSVSGSDSTTAVKVLTGATAALTRVSAFLSCKEAKEATCQL